MQGADTVSAKGCESETGFEAFGVTPPMGLEHLFW